MRQTEHELEHKISAYIDALFAGVGASQQLFDLKEEITTNLNEKTLDYKNRGISEDQAFKEAIVSLGDLSGLVAEMRQIGQDKAKQAVYSTMTARISLAGTIAGSLIILFGFFNVAMLYFMKLDAVSISGSGIFIVAG
ncbi:MAG: permease prefix domain 1-containing protein, partial [Bacillota bacterium]